MTAVSDPWDRLESSNTPAHLASTTSDRLEPLAEEYAKLRKEYDAISERLGQLENEIAYLFPEEAGDVAMSTSAYEVIVSRSERWTWDKDALQRFFPTEEYPDYIKSSLSVDKRKFQKLPALEQEKLRHALTRKLDNPKVKVIPNV
jgi:hypothetical protein